jgi:hypothetical protein
MRKKMSKKAIAISLTATLVLGGAGAAFAYWTTTGSGTGTAAAGTVATITAIQDSNPVKMGPGIDAQPLNGHFKNDAPDAGTAWVTTVTASIEGVYLNAVDAAAKTPKMTTCTLADFTLANPIMSVGADIPQGTSVGTWGASTPATIMFKNTAANQDTCKNVVVRFNYVVA